MKENDTKLIEFINNDLKLFWSKIKLDLFQESSPTQDFAEKLPEIFAYAEPDNNLRDKREIYLSIAELIKSKLNQPLPICLNAVHRLLQESNPTLLEDGSISGDTLIEKVKELIVMIQVYYEKIDNWMYNRKIEIYFLQEDLRKVQKIEDLIDWDGLPSIIRENLLRQPKINTTIIKLYPKEK